MSNICFMTSGHPPSDIRIFFKECRLLARAGFDVTLIVPHNKDEIIDGVKIKSVPIPQNRKERIFKTSKLVYHVAVKENADVYQICDPELLPYGLMFQLRNKKVVFDMLENLPKQILSKYWIHPKLRIVVSLGVKWWERIMLRKLYIIYAESSYKKDYPWVKQYCDVLNMPDLDALLKLKTFEKRSEFTIGYVGGLNQDRCSINMLEAIKNLQQEGNPVAFECIGPATIEHEKELRKFIDKNNLTDVNLHSYMIPTKCWEIIASCHVGLALLNPIPNYFESYPTKMFEYMAMGIPVITSDFPLYKDVIEANHCGFCVNPNDQAAICDTIKWIMNNPEEAIKMGENGRQAVMIQYNWKIEGEKLVNFYKKILAQ